MRYQTSPYATLIDARAQRRLQQPLRTELALLLPSRAFVYGSRRPDAGTGEVSNRFVTTGGGAVGRGTQTPGSPTVGRESSCIAHRTRSCQKGDVYAGQYG